VFLLKKPKVVDVVRASLLYVLNCVTWCIDELKGSITETVMSSEVVDLDVLCRFNLMYFTAFKTGVDEKRVRICGVAWHRVILEAWSNYYLDLCWVLLSGAMVVPMPMGPDDSI